MVGRIGIGGSDNLSDVITTGGSTESFSGEGTPPLTPLWLLVVVAGWVLDNLSNGSRSLIVGVGVMPGALVWGAPDNLSDGSLGSRSGPIWTGGCTTRGWLVSSRIAPQPVQVTLAGTWDAKGVDGHPVGMNHHRGLLFVCAEMKAGQCRWVDVRHPATPGAGA